MDEKQKIDGEVQTKMKEAQEIKKEFDLKA